MGGVSIAMLALATVAGGIARSDPTLPKEPRVRAWQTGLLAPDRMRHSSLAFALGVGLGIATRSPAAAGAGSLALGVLKEAGDSRRDRFDPVDLLADALGAGAGAAVTAALRH